MFCLEPEPIIFVPPKPIKNLTDLLRNPGPHTHDCESASEKSRSATLIKRDL